MHRNAAGRGWVGAALIGAVLAPAVQLQQAVLWPAEAYAACLALAVLAGVPAARRGGAWRTPAAFLLAAAGAFGLAGLRSVAYAGDALDPALEGQDLEVTGLIAAMPQPGDGGVRFRFAVETAKRAGVPVRLPPQLLLGWYHGLSNDAGLAQLQRASPELRAGERWRLAVRLKAPHGHLNPRGFDYELWLWEHGLQATGYVRAGPRDAVPQRLDATWRQPVEQGRQAARDAIHAKVGDARAAGVLAALVVGDQAAIERVDWDVFRATGVAHLMSISGLHVTMFGWLAAAVVGALWRRSGRLCLRLPAPHAACIAGVGLAAAYALFSGWGVPAQRTVWMMATAALLRLGARQWPWPWTWLLVCAVVVTLDPWALLQPGFWLSFVAVGVLFASGTGDGEAPAGLRHRLAHMLREQGVVTLALTPLSLLLFGQVSLVGLGANLVAIPWVTLVVTPLALGGLLVSALWWPAAWAVQLLSVLLQALASLPYATVAVAAAPVWAAAAGVVGGLLIAMPLPGALRALGLPLLLPVLLWQGPRPAPGEFELMAADVGQGNAVVVRTASHTLVYDAGPRYGPESDAGHRVLVPLLRQLGDDVDLLVLSHRDTDHTGGAAALLGMHPDARLLSSLETEHPLHALRAPARCVAGHAWEWDGVRFEMLHPPAAPPAPRLRPNALSCVLRIATPAGAALLAGDIEAAQEAMLADGGLAPADLLLVPHHGSRTSSSDVFLEAVRPKIGLVQAGYRNRFGHPAPAVTERYRARGIALVESARCGAASWSSAQPARIRCHRDEAARYWHHRVPPPESH